MKPCILMVDDTEANLVALEALFEDMDCELVRATSGNEALKLLLKRDFALMLLDVQMPEMDGYEVASYARANPATQHVPIIFITAMHPTELSMLRGYGTGAVDVLFKPVDAFILRSKVTVFLELYRGKRALAVEVASRERVQAALEVANAALKHFTYAASHDLRAPLRTLNGFLEALDDEARAQMTDTARDYLDRCRRASTRMTALLESLLAYAQLSAPIARSTVDCDALAAQASADHAARLTKAGGEVSIGALPKVHGDPARVYQLFLNLIGNAIKFARADVPVRIEITGRVENREAVVSIQDNGIGVSPEDRKRVFEAFARVQAQSKYEGSGLGLTICKQIVQQHGGRIWMESEGEGRGTRVLFALPVVDG